MKLHIVYNKKYEPISDGDVTDFVLKKIRRVSGTDQELQVNVSNEIVVLAFRVAVKNKIINPKDILFYNENTDTAPINIDKDGRLDNWPKGFCDMTENCLMQLI